MSIPVIDERTPGAQLQLPHPQNKLEDDVLRLRHALQSVDSLLGDIVTQLQSKALDSDLNMAVNALQQGINNLSVTVNGLQQNKVGVVNGKPGPSVDLTAADIGALGLGQYGFGAEALPVGIADLDLAPARTQIFMGSNLLHAPMGSAGFFMVFQLVRSDQWITQLAFGLSDLAGFVFMRQMLNGTWSTQWREISGRLPIGYVDDSSGHMYGDDAGGLNMTNVWRYANVIYKAAPVPSADGDLFGIVVTNGRLDNRIYAPGNGTTVMGSDFVTLDLPGPYNFKYFQTINDWRLA
ncbi:MAG: pyocin knob domain-containing protein [Rhodoferax sp.]